MDGELLLALGVVIISLGGAVAMSGRANVRMADATRKSADATLNFSTALTKQTDTNIKLNNELQETIKERREWEKERRSWERERQRLEDDQLGQRKTIDLLLSEQARLQAALKTEQTARQLAEKGRDVEINNLSESIESLRRDVRERDQKIALLSSQLNESEAARQSLANKIGAQLNGKVDKLVENPADESVPVIPEEQEAQKER